MEEKEGELNTLLNNWLRAPIAHTLERHGFKRMFSNNAGIYFLPLSQLPEKYHDYHREYFEEIIIPKAGEYLEQIRTNPFMESFEGSTKFLVISNVVEVGDLELFEEERNLRISAPALEDMMLNQYVEKENADITRLYVNDIVSNVDFRDQINETSNTGRYLLKNFEVLKRILWEQHQIDIYKPIQLRLLTDAHAHDVAIRMNTTDNSCQPHWIKRMLLKQVQFYNQLAEELEEIKTIKKAA